MLSPPNTRMEWAVNSPDLMSLPFTRSNRSTISGAWRNTLKKELIRRCDTMHSDSESNQIFYLGVNGREGGGAYLVKVLAQHTQQK